VVCTINCADGTISAHYEYDPFGRLVCKEGSYAEDNEYRFSTKRYCQQWSLYDYGYRHYSPDLGRWMSRDPIGEDGGQNVYIYCVNKPITKSDIYGLVFIPFFESANEFLERSPRDYLDMYQRYLEGSGTPVTTLSGELWQSIKSGTSYQEQLTKLALTIAKAAQKVAAPEISQVSLSVAAIKANITTVGESPLTWNATLALGHFDLTLSTHDITISCGKTSVTNDDTCRLDCKITGFIKTSVKDKYTFGADIDKLLGKKLNWDENTPADIIFGWGAPFDINASVDDKFTGKHSKTWAKSGTTP